MRTALPSYTDFKTGLSYADVAQMLWVDSDNPDDWKRKSKGVVLRIFNRIKRDMYDEMVRAADAERFMEEHGYPVEWAGEDATETTTDEGETTMALCMMEIELDYGTETKYKSLAPEAQEYFRNRFPKAHWHRNIS